MQKTVIAAIAMAAVLFTAPVASAQVCVVGVIAAAIHVSWHDHRELTTKEASTCGLSTLFETPEPPKKKVAHRAKRH